MQGRALRVLVQGSARRAPRRCEAPTDGGLVCDAATREGKPFCSDHVPLAPYVQVVAEGLALREREEQAIELRPWRGARRAVLLVEDLVRHLTHHGPGTVEGLARVLNLSCRVTEALAKRLEREGRASTRFLDRGRLAVALRAPEPSRPFAAASVALSRVGVSA